MRHLLLIVLLSLVLPLSAGAASSCGDAASAGTLIQRVWEAGFDHPIYQRPAVQSFMRQITNSMELEDGAELPRRGFILISPTPGAISLKVVGSFFVKDNVLTFQFSEVQLVDQPASSFMTPQPLPYSERLTNMNLQMGYLVAATEGAAKLYAKRNPTLTHFRVGALDVRSPSLRTFLEESHFKAVKGTARDLMLVLDLK